MIMSNQKLKLKFFILSALLISICSGLVFYRQLFLEEIKLGTTSKFEIEELKFTDLKINAALYEMRSNLNISSDELLLLKNKSTDLINILIDSKQSNKELQSALNEIKTYFGDKNKNIETFLLNAREVQADLKSLYPLYNEMAKNNIKFTLEGKDFYRECISDALMYLVLPSKDSDWKFNENIKILSQIMAYSKSPVPVIEKYSKAMESIKKRSSEMTAILTLTKEKNVNDQIDILLSYESGKKVLSESRGEKFLILIFIAVITYVLSTIYVLKKI